MTALALRDDQTYWDDKQIAVLQAGGIDGDVTEPELMAFLHECQRRKLDPFSRQIYLIGRFDKRQKRKVYRSQTSIDGFRLIARRAADRSGIDYSYEDTIWFDNDGAHHEVWLQPRPPAAAKVVVVRNGSRFDAVARFGAYAQTDRDGNVLGLWQSMPDVLIAKCAEALALRKAFPEDLGGIYAEEEMAQADNPQRVTATAEVIRDEPARQNGHDQNGGSQPENGQRWADTAIAQAAAFKSEAEGQKLWRESAAAVLDGRATPGEATHIQNIINARVADRRKEASERLLRHLSEDDDWRDQVRGLTSDDEARETIEELGRLKGSGTMNETRAGRIAAAIIARFPKAVLKEGEGDG
jgi:phage recombination protein Bet